MGRVGIHKFPFPSVKQDAAVSTMSKRQQNDVSLRDGMHSYRGGFAWKHLLALISFFLYHFFFASFYAYGPMCLKSSM